MDTIIPSIVKVVMKDVSLIQVVVEVPWYLKKCSHCKVFGHNDKTCTAKLIGKPVAEKKVWVSKSPVQSEKGKNAMEIFETDGASCSVAIQNVTTTDSRIVYSSPIHSSASKQFVGMEIVSIHSTTTKKSIGTKATLGKKHVILASAN
ncbi:hypothetical protein PTKIN_Ptkin01aG0249700 [Pterospermum kingtungense]